MTLSMEVGYILCSLFFRDFDRMEKALFDNMRYISYNLLEVDNNEI